MDYVSKIPDLQLEKVYNNHRVRNVNTATACDYLDFIRMNILVMEVSVHKIILYDIIPNLENKLESNDAYWLSTFYTSKVFDEVEKILNIENAVVLQNVSELLLFNKYSYKEVWRGMDLPSETPDTSGTVAGEDGASGTVNPPFIQQYVELPDYKKYSFYEMALIEPNDDPEINPDYIGHPPNISIIDVYSEMPQVPPLPNNMDSDLPLFYKQQVPEKLKYVMGVLTSNNWRKFMNIYDGRIIMQLDVEETPPTIDELLV